MSKRSVQATKDGLQTLKQAKASKQDDDGKRLTYERIAAKAGLDTKTVKKFFYGHRVDRDSALAITEKALGMKVTDVVDPVEWEQPSATLEPEQTTPDWRNICLAMLEEQRETQRLRRQATERGFELNVYVPLGLLERKQQQRRSGDVPLEQVYQLDKQVITQEYQHDRFLKDVIGQEPIQAGKSKHIAIIGEPGAGKTTLLEEIAAWIQKNEKGLPICIALADLQGQTLKDYLLQTWLKRALPLIRKLSPEAVPSLLEVPQALQAALANVFCEGRVWLLLDGVDEMDAVSPVQALATIQAQLTDWLASARVVLTCRLNIWDVRVNKKRAGFDTYKTLEFTPAQVEEFIQKWFACANELERGKQLQTKLNEGGRERIRELVKNPLRLVVLCQTFYFDNQGELPKTKAELYSGFTEYFYEWKQEQYEQKYQQPLTKSIQRELNEALSKLALAGINSEARFRLRENLACEMMGERLFNLARDLGWLNLVDRETGTREAVYAFFHPTFQEYFAAQAIADWHFFLNHVPHNPVEGTYRIFEPQWKEVILLWLGRPHEEVAKEQKEDFIRALVKFEDGCWQFYWYRAFFLAAAGITEFRDCIYADEIVAILVECGAEIYTSTIVDRIVGEAARATLLETERTRAINALINVLDDFLDEDVRWKVFILLEKIGTGNSEVIDALTGLMQNSPDEELRQEAAFFLGKIDLDQQKAIDFLRQQLLNTTLPDWLRLRAASFLGKIDQSNQDAIKFLTELINQNEGLRLEAASTLGRIAPRHPKAIKTLTDLLNTNQGDSLVNVRLLAACSLVQTDPNNPDAIRVLREFVEPSHELWERLQAATCLGQTHQGKDEAIKVLLEVINEIIGTTQDRRLLWQAVWSLKQIGSGIFDLFQTGLARTFLGEGDVEYMALLRLALLKYCLEQQEHFEESYYKDIWDCAQDINNPAVFYQVW